MTQSKELTKQLKRNSNTKKMLNSKKPAWRGPEDDGISQSLMQMYICDRERFRIRTVEGLKQPDSFSPAREYGSLFHIAEEHKEGDWKKAVEVEVQKMMDKFSFSQAEVEKWYNVLLKQFPIYLDYYSEIDGDETTAFREQKIRVKIELPSGRSVFIRGMIDGGVWLENGTLYLQENKIKGQVNEMSIVKQMSMDFQTMVYTCVTEYGLSTGQLEADIEDSKIGGVLYNIIRRPLSGGKGSIRPHKKTKTKEAETLPHYYNRLRDILVECPEEYFLRLDCPIDDNKKNRFLSMVLIPLLENICDDYEWWKFCKQNDENPFNFNLRHDQFYHGQRHWMLAYGIYNKTMEGREGAYDEYLSSGSIVGLEYNDEFFPELS